MPAFSALSFNANYFRAALIYLLGSTPALALYGGVEAPTQHYPSMVHYALPGDPVSNCGGVKVGEYHYLTAAHCVTKAVGAQLEEAYLPGKQLDFLLNRSVGAREARKLTIVSTLVHPRWTEIAPKHWRPVNASRDPKAADLALIIVKEKTDTAIQKISFASLQVGQEVIICGSGKEEISNPNEVLSRRFKIAIKPLVSITPNSIGVTAHDPGLNTITLPFSGDSGSPVYTPGSDGSLDLVGIMSWVYPYPSAVDPRGLPLGLKPDSPAHAARLDSYADIKSWIYENLKP